MVDSEINLQDNRRPSYEDDGEGSPSAAWLYHFARCSMSSQEAAAFLTQELLEISGQMPCLVVERIPSRDGSLVVAYYTGGWSGAEELVDEMLKHQWIKEFHSKWERGGAFYFTIPKEILTKCLDDKPNRVR